MVIKTTKRSAFATGITPTEIRNINTFFIDIDIKGKIVYSRGGRQVRITPIHKLTNTNSDLIECLAGALEALSDKEYYARLSLVSDRLTLAGTIKPQQVQVSDDPIKMETVITKAENAILRDTVWTEIAKENKLPVQK